MSVSFTDMAKIVDQAAEQMAEGYTQAATAHGVKNITNGMDVYICRQIVRALALSDFLVWCELEGTMSSLGVIAYNVAHGIKFDISLPPALMQVVEHLTEILECYHNYPPGGLRKNTTWGKAERT